ncbi:MAG: hypothetical protein IH901_04925 [Proteobacteria bacterium]|nr:hypothetical protein [Pseudomonadota bacterium]
MKGFIRQIINIVILIAFLGLAWGSSDNDSNNGSSSSSSSDAISQDVDNAFAIGEVAVASGVAVEYDISGWNQAIDITISSILPGDARLVADELCKVARQLDWSTSWSIRVFLTIGDRPAAICRIR